MSTKVHCSCDSSNHFPIDSMIAAIFGTLLALATTAGAASLAGETSLVLPPGATATRIEWSSCGDVATQM